MMTYAQAAKQLKVGDRVRLSEAYGEYPIERVPAGETGTIFEVSADDVLICIKLDGQYASLEANVLQLSIMDVNYDDAALIPIEELR